MTYQSFLNTIIDSASNLFGVLTPVYNALMNNYIFKTILYTILLFFVIEILFIIINLLKTIFKSKKQTKNEKVE